MITVLSGVPWLLRFAMGSCVFSFLNVVSCRLPKGESVIRGRSHCADCGRTLTAGELIPCVSYVMQRGRCRGCGRKISGRYFLTELAGGLAFAWCGVRFGYGECGLLSLRGLLAFVYLGILMMVALIDWDTRIIYDRFHIFILLLGAAALRLSSEHSVPDCLIGAGIVSLPMLLIAFAIDGAFGGGDIKLMAASGFLLGWRAVLVAMFLGLLSGGVYAVGMMAARRLTGKDHFAFGPFLALGLAAACFYGDCITDWYIALL